MGFPNVGLGLIDPRDPETIVIRHLGGGFRRPLPYERRISITQGIMGAAARERRVQMVQTCGAIRVTSRRPSRRDIRAELAVPIIHGEEVLGVLNPRERITVQ